MVFIKNTSRGKVRSRSTCWYNFLISTISEFLINCKQRKHRVGRVTKLVKRYNKVAVGEVRKYPLVLGLSWLKGHEIEILHKLGQNFNGRNHISIICEEELLHGKELYKVDNSEDPYILEKEPLSQSSESSKSFGD
ncbi:hypothetical protein RCL_jg10285.t1 [Rhizophagus clarus]|uniref:Uncharacterized protein n=1 Tax=Rhizophagus clarus TaxID=94130 RepID=A0A8H3KVG2_9GLOM|nr:hypothetical protein RCL_jg10285.t1 [Rhizophagus clarus]